MYKLISEATKEETRIACLKGEVDHDGILVLPSSRIDDGPKGRIKINIICYRV